METTIFTIAINKYSFDAIIFKFFFIIIYAHKCIKGVYSLYRQVMYVAHVRMNTQRDIRIKLLKIFYCN